MQLNKLNRFVLEISSVDGITIDLTERLSDKLFAQVRFEKKYLISQDQDFYQKFVNPRFGKIRVPDDHRR